MDYILVPTPDLRALAPIVIRILLAPVKLRVSSFILSAANPNLLAALPIFDAATALLFLKLLTFVLLMLLMLATGSSSSLSSEEEDPGKDGGLSVNFFGVIINGFETCALL